MVLGNMATQHRFAGESCRNRKNPAGNYSWLLQHFPETVDAAQNDTVTAVRLRG